MTALREWKMDAEGKFGWGEENKQGPGGEGSQGLIKMTGEKDWVNRLLVETF